MEGDHIRKFFSSEENWEKVRRISKRHFPHGYDAEDVAQDIAEKLLTHNGETHFPKVKTEQMKFITRMVMNYFLDSIEKAKKMPETVDEIFAWNEGEVEMPDMTEKWFRLNELILAKKDLFTEDQLKLWSLVFNRTTTKDLSKILGKPPHNIATAWEKLRAKIRQHIKRSDLL